MILKDEYVALLKELSAAEKILADVASKKKIDVKRCKAEITKVAAKLQKKTELDKLAKPHLKAA